MRCWAEVDLDRLLFNLDQIKKCTKAKILAVIKSNAYGHGLVQIAKALEGKVWGFCVLDLDEALLLRQANITSPVLILGKIDKGEDEVVNNDLRAVVFDEESVQKLSATAKKYNKFAKIHIEIDTGMNRLGIRWHQAKKFIEYVVGQSNIEIEGLCSHIGCSETDGEYARLQLKRLLQVKENLHKFGIKSILSHIANSATMLKLPQAHLDAVRLGIMLYGYLPFDGKNFEVDLQLKPIMRLVAKICQIKTVGKGEHVSYGNSYITKKKITVAVVNCGYADGYPRALSNIGWVTINHKIAKVIGYVTMDFLMLDITNCGNVSLNDKIILFGDNPTAADLASAINTISYEILTNINTRVKRIYLKNGG